MPYRNKIYVAFDGDNDIHYYRLMKAWHQSDHTDFSFNDAHDLRQARDTSQEESIKRSLRERLNNTKVFVLLVGAQTRFLFKFVRWEIDTAISLRLPIIVVNLNGMRQMDSDRCPPILRDELAVHVSFNSAIMQRALENWPDESSRLALQGKRGAFYYDQGVYQQLGL